MSRVIRPGYPTIDFTCRQNQFKSLLRTACFLAIVTVVNHISMDSAVADLVSSTVNISAYYPTQVNLLSNPGYIVVSETEVEYQAGVFVGYSQALQIDITGDQIIVTNTNNALPFGLAAFNGFILEILDGPQITSAVADIDASDFVPFDLSIDGNRLLMNFRGADDPPSSATSVSFIDIETTAVPEPGVVQVLGLIGLGLLKRRNRDVC